MADFPIYCHVRYDTELNKNGKPEIVCKDVSDHDFVEVVRCKDCTYFNHVKCQEERAGLCEHFDTYMYISDYCSDGYRRDDNG